jgi:hypothetical protein
MQTNKENEASQIQIALSKDEAEILHELAMNGLAYAARRDADEDSDLGSPWYRERLLLLKTLREAINGDQQH